MKTRTPAKLYLLYFIATMLLLASQQSLAQVPCGPGKVIICHKGKNTLCISENALPAHLAHGDFVGSCEGTCDVLATGGTINCTVTTVQLFATSSTTGVSFSWIGPNGFTSTQQNPNTSIPGTYTVTVATVSGCTITDTAVVKINNAPPNVTANGGAITCDNTTATLTASSTTSGATFRWTGPGGFTSTVQNPAVSADGTYTLTVTNPANGCTSSTSAVVAQNTTPPGASAAASGALTCVATSVSLMGSSGTSGVTFSWTGPGGFSSLQQNPIVSSSGAYILTTRNAVNGCTSTSSATVIQNTTPPGVTVAALGTLTCTTSNVLLSASSLTSGVSYNWTGPGGFNSTTQRPSVNAPGSYTITVRNPVNACTSTASATVQENKVLPGVTTTTVAGMLTCSVTTMTLSASSPTSGVLYRWTGPRGYASNQQNSVTSLSGSYQINVTNPANGCTSSSGIAVSQNNTPPTGVSATASNIVTCVNGRVTLQGSSTTPGVGYRWSGPGGFISATQAPQVTTAGTYLLAVTNPVNGCSATVSVNVQQDLSPPDGVSTTASAQLTCKTLSIVLTGTSITSGVSFNWVGPGGFTSVANKPSVNAPGTYVLTVTNPASGCSTIASVNVQQDISQPSNVTAMASGLLTCSTAFVTLSGISTTAGVVFSWQGPLGFTSSAQHVDTTIPGGYLLTVTNPVNGCNATAPVDVAEEKCEP